MGPQEYIDVKKYCKTLGTIPVPGVNVLANQRSVYGHMTFERYIVGRPWEYARTGAHVRS